MGEKNMIENILTFVYLITFLQCAFIHRESKEKYNMLLQLCIGEFTVPVTARPNIEKAAIVKFQRANGKFPNQGDMLYYDGKKLS